MMALKNLFSSIEEEGSSAAKTLKTTKKIIRNNMLKPFNYIEPVGKIKSYKKLSTFLLNLYASETCCLEDFHNFEEAPIELMEFFVPQIVGFYTTHMEIYP